MKYMDEAIKEASHGISHNERVALLSFYIALKEGLSDKEIELLVEAAKYHDIGRKEVKGKEHGRRSADIIAEHSEEIFGNDKSKNDITIIRILCIAHSTSDQEIEALNVNNSIRRMINVLKDADALDRVRLPRFGKIEPSYLRTDTSKTMIEASKELYKTYRQVQYESGLTMNSELFSMGHFNVIEDNENYYIFRTISNEDIEELEDESETNLRTHRERANIEGGETRYNEEGQVTLQEVYDSVKVTRAGKSTNCISFSTNANVSLDFNNNRYVMIAVPKSSTEASFAVGKYMLEEIDKIIANKIGKINQSSRSLDLISQIDSSKSLDEIREIVGESYVGVKRENGKRYTGRIQSKESFIARFDRKQYFTEEQQLEYAKVVAKMSILEISGEMRSVLTSQGTNSNLLSALGTAFSASEAMHYGAIPKERVISVSQENMEILAILQQAEDQKTVDPEIINRLKNIVLERIKFGQTFEIGPENVTDSRISIEEAYNYFTVGGENYKLPYEKTTRAIEITKKLAASKNRVYKLCESLKELPECREMVQYIDAIATKHIIPRPEFTTRVNNKGIKIAESVSIDFNEGSNEELFSNEEMEEILNVINEYSVEELEKIVTENPNSEIINEFLNVLLDGREYKGGISEYYAEAIISRLDLTNIYKHEPTKAKQIEIRTNLIQRLQSVNVKKIYDILLKMEFDENDIPGIITNLILEDGIGDNRTDTFEKLVASDELEQILIQKRNNLNVKVQPLHLDRTLGIMDNHNPVSESSINLRDYQKKALDKINEIFEERRFAGVVLPTGSGKSFVAMSEMLAHKKENIIYFAPQIQILAQVQKHILKNIVGKDIITDEDIEILKDMPEDEIEAFLSTKVYNRGIIIKKEIANLKRASTKEEIQRIKQRFLPRQTKENDDVMNEINIIFPHLKMYCYASLDSKDFDESIINSNPDLIIFDEAHRTGANTWQQKIEELLDNNPQSKILAVTATPERDNDLEETLKETGRTTANMLDYMAERYGGYSKDEIKDEQHLAANMTLIEAMQRGYVVEPIIVGFDFTLIQTEEYAYVVNTIKKLEEKGDDNPLLETLKAKKAEMDEIIGIQSDDIKDIRSKVLVGMQKVIEENIPDKLKNGRFIVFLPQKPSTEKETTEEYVQNEINRVSTYFSKVNPNIEAGYLLSNRGDGRKNSQAINDFESSDSDTLKLLFAIDMLNEGVHVEAINGELMLRKIGDGSNILFFQQIGRVIYAINENEVVLDEDRPIIFDVYNNCLSRNLDYEVNKTTPKSDLKRLEEAVEWIEKHQRIPDINSEDIGESRRAVFLKRIQGKYEKYLEGFVSKNLTEQQKKEIQTIIEICKGINIGNEEINIFEFDFPDRIVPPPEVDFRVTAFRVTGKQKRFLDVFDEAKQAVERSKFPERRTMQLSDRQRLEKIIPILKTLSDYGIEIGKDTFKSSSSEKLSIREIISENLPENAKKQVVQDLDLLRVSEYDMDNYAIGDEYLYVLSLFASRGKKINELFSNYSFDEIRACGILNGFLNERKFYVFNIWPDIYTKEIIKLNYTNINTGTAYDENGFDLLGYDNEGYDRSGFDEYGYDRNLFGKNGISIYGFKKDGTHSKTGTHLDPNGFDEEGCYWKENPQYPGDDSKRIKTNQKINEYGFDRMGRYFTEKDGELVHSGWYDGKRFPLDDYEKFRKYGEKSEGDLLGFELGDRETNKRGFKRDGTHSITGTFFDENDRDFLGWHKLDERGFVGFKENSVHVETRQPYDKHFFDIKGYYWAKGDDGVYRRTRKRTDINGFDSNGINRTTKKPWDIYSFDIDGNYWTKDPEHPEMKINTGKPLNPDGLDRKGAQKKAEEEKKLKEQRVRERRMQYAEQRKREIEEIKKRNKAIRQEKRRENEARRQEKQQEEQERRLKQRKKRESKRDEQHKKALENLRRKDSKSVEDIQKRKQILDRLLEKDITQEEISNLMEEYCGMLELTSEDKKAFAIQLQRELSYKVIQRGQLELLKKRFDTYRAYTRPFEEDDINYYFIRGTRMFFLDDGSEAVFTKEDALEASQYLKRIGKRVCKGTVIETMKRIRQGQIDVSNISGQEIGKATFDVPTSDCDEAETYIEGLINGQERRQGGEGK